MMRSSMMLALGPLLADAHGGLTFPVPRNNHNAVDPRNWVSRSARPTTAPTPEMDTLFCGSADKGRHDGRQLPLRRAVRGRGVPLVLGGLLPRLRELLGGDARRRQLLRPAELQHDARADAAGRVRNLEHPGSGQAPLALRRLDQVPPVAQPRPRAGRRPMRRRRRLRPGDGRWRRNADRQQARRPRLGAAGQRRDAGARPAPRPRRASLPCEAAPGLRWHLEWAQLLFSREMFAH